jgi:type IV secretion system protein VirB5
MARKLALAVKAVSLALLLALAGRTSAQGMPVIDVANLVQAVQNVQADAERYVQLAQTLAQLRSTHDAMTGVRNLAAALSDPALQNYLPPASYQELDAAGSLGFAGLTARAQSLRAAGMLYNCLERAGAALVACQAALASPYQYKAMVSDALDRSRARIAQINALMRQAAATVDPKGIAEAQARIGAEIALLSHEMSQAQLAGMAADAGRQVSASKTLEAQLANLVRPIR